ncbi:hypothetical protein SUGI_0071960 [Cryptomeria japonica]|nr:hypothetical protein SUGI_0071960 [Cryptomeria japonica]
MKGNGATGLAISLFGALVMPHNLFLHSALVLSRKIPASVSGTDIFLINVAVVSVTGAVCTMPDLSGEDAENCREMDLDNASFLLRNAVGNWSSTIFAVALLASGQSSTITGTYAAQYVMQMILSFETPFVLIPLLKFTSIS